MRCALPSWGKKEAAIHTTPSPAARARLLRAAVAKHGCGGRISAGVHAFASFSENVDCARRRGWQCSRPGSGTKCASTSTDEEYAPLDQSTSKLGSQLWDLFSSKVAGEWRGSSMTFDELGELIPIPENFVDEAFKEWQIQVYDWQTQCSMKADENGLAYKLRRLFTATGCEADSVAMTENFEGLKSAKDRMDEDKTITASGDYCIGPRYLPEGNGEMDIEISFAKRKMEHRFRVRAHLINQSKGDLLGWKIGHVEVHKEVYQGEFVDGLDVEDFNRPVGKIDEEDKTEYQFALEKVWRIDSRYTYRQDKDGKMFLEEKFAGMGRELYGWDINSRQFIPLPEGLWCCLDVSSDPIGNTPWMTDEERKEAGHNKSWLDNFWEPHMDILSFQVGWLVQPKKLLCCTREYHETKGLVTVDYCGCNFFLDLP